MNIKEYWKAYHAKNRDKINERRRIAYHEGRPKKLIAKPIKEFVTTIEPAIPKNEPKTAGKCIYCYSYDTQAIAFQGGIYAVCSKHTYAYRVECGLST